MRARLVRTARDWRWSNYRATAGLASVPPWLETGWILGTLAERRPEAQRAYRRFVAEGKNQPSPWQALKNQIYLGSEAFVEEMQLKVAVGRPFSEIPKIQLRTVDQALLKGYFQKHKDRDTAIFEAYRTGGLVGVRLVTMLGCTIRGSAGS